VPTSTPTPTFTQPAVPGSRIQVGCSDLTTATAASAALGVKVASAAPAPSWADPGGISESFRLVQHTALIQAGALDCSWTDDPSRNIVGLKVQVLAQGQAGWAAHRLAQATTIAGWADGAYFECDSGTGQFCNYDVMTNGQWVGLQFYGPATYSANFNTATRSLAKMIVSTITSAAPPNPLWVGPASTHTIPTDCASIFPDGSNITGLPGLKLLTPTQSLDYGVGGDVEGAALILDGGYSCVWVTPNGSGVIQLLILPGGSWAWTADPAQSNASLALKPTTGLGDSALVGCTASECASHILFGGYWIAVDSAPPQSQTPVDQKILAAFG
jgi:hypothetical protein